VCRAVPPRRVQPLRRLATTPTPDPHGDIADGDGPVAGGAAPSTQGAPGGGQGVPQPGQNGPPQPVVETDHTVFTGPGYAGDGWWYPGLPAQLAWPVWWTFQGRWWVAIGPGATDWDSGAFLTDYQGRTRGYWNTVALQSVIEASPDLGDGVITGRFSNNTTTQPLTSSFTTVPSAGSAA
jgi:hypothetical protein